EDDHGGAVAAVTAYRLDNGAQTFGHAPHGFSRRSLRCSTQCPVGWSSGPVSRSWQSPADTELVGERLLALEGFCNIVVPCFGQNRSGALRSLLIGPFNVSGEREGKMNPMCRLSLGLMVSTIAASLIGAFPSAKAQQGARDEVIIDKDDIGGVVRGPNGPE